MDWFLHSSKNFNGSDVNNILYKQNLGFIIMSIHILKEILKGSTENGFKAAVFSKNDGLPLAGVSTPTINEKALAPIVALFSETCSEAKEQLSLTSEMQEIKIKYADATIICRNIIIEISKSENTNFLISAVAPPEEDIETMNYQAKLLDWAIENSRPVLTDLFTI